MIARLLPGIFLVAFLCASTVAIADKVTDKPTPTKAFLMDLGGLSRLTGQNNPTNNGYATAVSADGNVVVGAAKHPNYSMVAFRWTLRTGMDSLDHSPLRRPFAGATAVNGNGSVVVGNIASDAFRWTEEQGFMRLGTLAGSKTSVAYAVSADGRVIVGHSGGQAYKWTKETGMIALRLPGNPISAAKAVSADGRLIFGEEDVLGKPGPDGRSDMKMSIICWGENGDIIRYLVPAGIDHPGVNAVSANGKIVAGVSFDQQSRMRATLWYSPTQMVDLGFLHGGSSSSANAINADGTVVVGFADDGANKNRQSAYRWTRETGMESISEWVTKAGGRVPSSIPRQALGVSADGSTVVGTLDNGNPFVAYVPIPQTGSQAGGR